MIVLEETLGSQEVLLPPSDGPLESSPHWSPSKEVYAKARLWVGEAQHLYSQGVRARWDLAEDSSLISINHMRKRRLGQFGQWSKGHNTLVSALKSGPAFGPPCPVPTAHCSVYPALVLPWHFLYCSAGWPWQAQGTDVQILASNESNWTQKENRLLFFPSWGPMTEAGVLFCLSEWQDALTLYLGRGPVLSPTPPLTLGSHKCLQWFCLSSILRHSLLL